MRARQHAKLLDQVDRFQLRPIQPDRQSGAEFNLDSAGSFGACSGETDIVNASSGGGSAGVIQRAAFDRLAPQIQIISATNSPDLALEARAAWTAAYLIRSSRFLYSHSRSGAMIFKFGASAAIRPQSEPDRFPSPSSVRHMRRAFFLSHAHQFARDQRRESADASK